ncbi:MAG: hypothetical protein WCG91_00090 [Candidatus Shapirobacteria bacterium]
MTKEKYKKPWNPPGLASYNQPKGISKNTIEDLEKRTKAIQEEILGKKDIPKENEKENPRD